MGVSFDRIQSSRGQARAERTKQAATGRPCDAEEGQMSQRKFQVRLAVMKVRLAMIEKALKQEQASMVQARRELGLSVKKALPKRKRVRRAAKK